MAKLSPQERFNQLLSFLKDPQASPHPTMTLDDPVWLEGRQHSAGVVADLRQEAIGIMESGIFREGCLKGTRRTPNMYINKLEKFVFQVAAAACLAKLHREKTTDFVFNDFNRRPRTFDELNEACSNMLNAFDMASRMIRRYGFIRPDRLAGIKRELRNLKTETLLKIKEEMDFNLVNELILIFIKHFPEYQENKQINLIATHIFTLNKIYTEKKLKDLLGIDAIRKRLTLAQKS